MKQNVLYDPSTESTKLEWAKKRKKIKDEDQKLKRTTIKPLDEGNKGFSAIPRLN